MLSNGPVRGQSCVQCSGVCWSLLFCYDEDISLAAWIYMFVSIDWFLVGGGLVVFCASNLPYHWETSSYCSCRFLQWSLGLTSAPRLSWHCCIQYLFLLGDADVDIFNVLTEGLLVGCGRPAAPGSWCTSCRRIQKYTLEGLGVPHRAAVGTESVFLYSPAGRRSKPWVQSCQGSDEPRVV